MELRQLRYFVTVVEEANFTRAAARLHLAQPGLSAQIRQLERELGQPLLDRSGRTVTPTAVGAAVLPHARAALAAAQQVSHTVDEFTGLLRGQVRIGLISGAADSEVDIAQVLADFHRDHPQIAIAMTENTSEVMYAALRRDDLDIVLISIAEAGLDPAVATATVLETTIVAAVAADSPEFPDRIDLAELCAHPLICLPLGTGIRKVLDTACAAQGLTPNVAYEAVAPPLLIRLAAHRLGVAIVPALSPADAAAFGVRTLTIDPPMYGTLLLAWNTDRPLNPAAKILLERLRSALVARPGRDPVPTGPSGSRSAAGRPPRITGPLGS
ncbi:LysR family transcriptional regulator [Nocardia aurantia]|uniref:HTH-type transcriptional regulator CynR n=1 Tax=Nocardia aurantia TaxID=2585199 RepID=A0A7K0DHV7_9NOCA|nr:LysR family transcriptional regulator [Nocardia aurantia]MQY25385.1 HTH-type transcriptional regulator CynR [Nocardia aurantia]